MSRYERFVWPRLEKMDAETAHEKTLQALERAQNSTIGRGILRRIAGEIPSRPVEVAGLTFPHVLGLAAGFDKEARVAEGVAMLGFGHVEVGTLTPRPQAGNPRPRIFRLPAAGAVINRMGFPNEGVAAALPRLKELPADKGFVLGVSLGKQKETPLEHAVEDYVTVMRQVYRYADYLAVNISSPNTPGLRDLQGGDYLGHLLGTLETESGALARLTGVEKRPLFLKIAPDLSWGEIDTILAAATAQKIAGIIATNTTISRPGLKSEIAQEKGGLSGLPLKERSTAVIRYVCRQTDLPVIGVGGVRNATDAQEKLDAGAVLVQLYTGLIYEGPGMVGRLLRELYQ
ncbi:MAG TPA: quinone-dependent dihydroorotate dehydrogenase [Anaerolineae bacterium]|nr:quinone-dependent dihydroorotate dehydrogenase [Anaerolineae bacterium]